MKLNKKEVQNPIFIISSGRTGSTLISKILNKHKDICIISDLIEPVGNNEFLEKNVSISQKNFFELISRKTSLSRIYFWRKRKTKELLYLPKKDKDISCLNCYTIPFVFKDVNNVFNQLKKRFSSKMIRKKKSDHLIDFFNFFLKKTKKKIYVERTGGALHHLDKIIDFYPNAKIILNLRNPLETAISMRNYPFFRMYELMLKNKKLVKWEFDKKKSYQTYGKMLNQWYKKFFLEKRKIKKKNFFYYNYEDLIAQPEKTLRKLILFILDKKKGGKYLTSFLKKNVKYIQKNEPKFFRLKKNNQKLLKKSLNNSISIIRNIDNRIITKYKI